VIAKIAKHIIPVKSADALITLMAHGVPIRVLHELVYGQTGAKLKPAFFTRQNLPSGGSLVVKA
jgi:hypothetical protein